MGRVLRHAANRLWYLSTLREAAAFHRSLGSIAATQEGLLLEMLRRNRGTEFGRRSGFAALRSAREYQQAVPVAEYRDFEPYIARIGAGEQNILTAELVLLLEPTGGSGGGSKLIPYTAGLKRQFQRGIAPWIADLYRNFPELLGGESYWSVSPAARHGERTSGGVPVGFEDDSDYAGGVGRLLVRSLQAVPEGVKRIVEMEGFWYATLLFLLRSRQLTLVSVWNPTFLTILCGHLERWWPRLADDIAAGTLTPPVPLDPAIAGQLGQRNRPDPDRAREIRAACCRGGDQAARHRELWPRLRLISSWCDGAAGEQAQLLRRLFPLAELQGKGLLATEGFATFPLAGVDGCLPALRSHFLEFLPRDGGEALLLHQLEEGRSYSLLITTAGGLYRYRLHDLVRVAGFRSGVPLFRFVGKEEHISDRFGEKLHEGHVHGVLRRAAARSGLSPLFAMLAFEERPRSGYVFFVEEPAAADGRLAGLGAEIDELLRENFHYRYCRDLGQLAPVRVFRIARDGRETYLRACCSHGQRLGDVKPLALHRGSGWAEAFPGRMLS